ncbi:MAG: Asp-tRNA(Asn)/Glu-tRNA(Gln) amidotransferase subunit GatA [Armatimonadota bacterium]|nr:Asp-tRNA(Asn)/Glu-tRNA(Gln) amidotransferase subunit GatA [Armatimonadota bacterium]
MADQITDLSAVELRERLVRGDISAQEVTEAFLQRIHALDPRLHAFLYVDTEGAIAQARQVDEQVLTGARRSGRELPPLAGIPVAVKDNICTKGIPTTCASRILEGWRPPYDATVVERLRRAGAIILGKTNLDEFAMGSSTENSGFGPTRNPWDLTRVPGGSSGGSAAAVAAGMAPLALGSDTGGSIRQPAALCGIVGLKPTYGRVSRYGLVAFASSLDQIGPMARTVTDCAILLNVIAGNDPRDSTSANLPCPDFTRALQVEVRGLRIGIPRECFVEGLQPEVREAVLQAARLFSDLGAVCEEISLPHLDYALPTYYLIAPAEASSNLARYDGVQYGYRAKAGDLYTMYARTRREGFGAEVKRRIMLGTYALSAGYYEAFYLKALQVRTLIKQDFDVAFQDHDLILMPTSPTVAFPLGEKVTDPLQMYLNDIFTIPVSLAGLPGISVPCGFANGLPIGLQLVGRPFDEETVLRAAFTFEQHTEYWKARPVTSDTVTRDKVKE